MSGMVIDPSRFEKLLQVIALVSVEAEDVRGWTNLVQAEDEFGELENCLQIFLEEWIQSKDELRTALRDTEASRAELERKLEVIDAQRMTIQELSTPIIDVWDDVLALPLVGTIDTRRASELTESLLARVATTNAKTVIVDLTGVEVLDTSTADHLGRLARASSLLGCDCVLTGISPAIARTLVALDVDLGTLRTKRTLRDALSECVAAKTGKSAPAARAQAPIVRARR